MKEDEPRREASTSGTIRGDSGDRPGFAGRVLTVLGLATLFAAAALLLVFAVDVFLLGFAGLLLAVFLRGLASILSRWTPLKGGWALAVVVLALAALIGLGGWYLASTIAAQFDELSSSLAETARGLQDRLRDTPWGESLLDATSAQQLASGALGLRGRITGAFSTALGAVANLVVILFVGLYVAADPGIYRRGLLRLLPPGHRGRAGEVLDELAVTLGRWLVGRVFNMAFIAVVTALGLWLLGVPLVLALASLAFLLNFIPYLGPVASAVPALLLALSIDPRTVLHVGLLYLGVQAVESYLLTPLVQQRAVKLPPALTILAQLLMGLLAGVLGLALATPLTAATITLVGMLYVEDVLGDRPDPGGGGPDEDVAGWDLDRRADS